MSLGLGHVKPHMGPFFYSPPQETENGRKLPSPGCSSNNIRHTELALLRVHAKFSSSMCIIMVLTLQIKIKKLQKIARASRAQGYIYIVIYFGVRLSKVPSEKVLQNHVKLILQRFRACFNCAKTIPLTFSLRLPRQKIFYGKHLSPPKTSIQNFELVSFLPLRGGE